MAPVGLGSLTALTELYLADNRLTTMPDIGALVNLTTLYLGTNQLTEAPIGLDALTALTELYLDGNLLTTIPDELGDLSLLEMLRLDHNHLTVLPDQLTACTRLKVLDVSSNWLSFVPLCETLPLRVENNRLLDDFRAQAKLLPVQLAGLDANQASSEATALQRDRNLEEDCGAKYWRDYLAGQPIALAAGCLRYVSSEQTRRWIYDAVDMEQLDQLQLKVLSVYRRQRMLMGERATVAFHCIDDVDVMTQEPLEPGDRVMIVGLLADNQAHCYSRRQLIAFLSKATEWGRQKDRAHPYEPNFDTPFVHMPLPTFFVTKDSLRYIQAVPMQSIYRAVPLYNVDNQATRWNFIARDSSGSAAGIERASIAYALMPV